MPVRTHPLSIAEGPCLYVPDPYGEGEFGILDGEHFTKAGTCGGGYWDVELCTCIGMLSK